MTTVEPIRNKSDIKKVEKVLAKQSQRDLMLFVLGTNCGLRISDLLSLNVGDVRNKTHIQIVEKKTGKFKKFPINDRLKPMIEDFVKGRRNAEPLFLSHWRHRLDRVTAYYLIRDACEKAGLQERIGTHSMRKTFGYHHYQQFKDVVILQKIFNHSSPQITLRYIGVEQDQIDYSYNPQEIKFIEGLLFLSMIPLHKDNFSRQKVFYLKAIELLNDTVKIRGKLNNEKVLSLVRSRG